MIIRKPYAFLIKNFKKIHIVLLILSLFVAYKLVDVMGFVNEFMRYGIYDAYNNPVTNHISFWLIFSLVIIVVGSSSLVLLLRYKNKPWKLYLVPVVEYFVLFLVLNMIKGFFAGYKTSIETTDLRMSKDLLTIFLLIQVPAIGIFFMRVFGLDIKKFNFNSDAEFLELSEEDREEFEVSLDVDVNSFKRLFRRLIRNIQYFYIEHKLVCKIIIGIMIVIFGYNSYKFIFVTHKSYKEGDYYNANGYTIQVNNSYFTDKSHNGNVISSKSNFVIVDVTIKNNSAPRKVYFENFHLKNGVDDYVTTRNAYAKEFQDLGKTYSNVKELKRDEVVNYIIVYKVSKKLNKNRFVLYYQEKNGLLRKIKLKVEDISNIEKSKKLNFGEDMKFTIKKKEETISFDSYSFSEYYEYVVNSCDSTDCMLLDENYTAPEGKTVLKIDFSSSEYEGKDMVDFSKEYGKINYMDDDNNEVSVGMIYPFSKIALGKSIYSIVPVEVQASKSVSVVYTIRNKSYAYKIK